MSRIAYDDSPQRMHDFDIELKLLLEAIYLKYQHDFRHYSMSSLRRRLVAGARRASACRRSRSCRTRILRDPADLRARCFHYLTVQVSDMFRDPGYFRALREQVRARSANLSVDQGLGGRLQHRRGTVVARDPVRRSRVCPSARCSTRPTSTPTRCARAESGHLRARAHRGLHAQNYLAAGGKRSLSDYYHAAYGGARVLRLAASRAWCSPITAWSTDSVFLEAHLVSCRNVLIYFDRGLQDRALGLFSDSLVRRGFLGLGSKESLRFSKHYAGVREFRERERIYQKR